MKIIKKYGKSISFFLIALLILNLIVSLLNLGGLMFTKTSDIILMIGMIIIYAVIGFSFGKTALKNGYMEGLKIGVCLLAFLILINLIFYQTVFSFERFLYYVVLILTSILGSMVGINRQKK